MPFLPQMKGDSSRSFGDGELSSSALKKAFACLWHSEEACSPTWTRPENLNVAVPAKTSFIVACFRHRNCAWGWLFSMAHFWKGIQAWQRKLPLSIWLNWGNLSPSKVEGILFPPNFPTLMGGNDASTKAFSLQFSMDMVLPQRFCMASPSPWMEPLVWKIPSK